jgi:hypothetical protein
MWLGYGRLVHSLDVPSVGESCAIPIKRPSGEGASKEFRPLEQLSGEQLYQAAWHAHSGWLLNFTSSLIFPATTQ